MPPVPDVDAALSRLFQRRPAVELSDLCRALRTGSRTTVFRSLKRVGYYSSYSHAGRFYTLQSIPAFDSRGLWSYGEARFSSRGTLRATIVCLVKEADAGCTHEELQRLLGLRVHDTLWSLVEEHQIGRERVETVFVYLDVDAARAEAQLARRRATKSASVTIAVPEPPLEASRVIAILVAIIQHPDYRPSRIVAELQSRSVQVTETQVEQVLETYGVKKTPRSPSRPSKRSERRRPR
jgi:hypothetical protein